MRSHREQGTVLVAALLFAVTVLGLVSAIISSGLAVKSQARGLGARQGAQHAAESGIHLAVAKLAGLTGPAFLDLGYVEGTMQGDGERAPRYGVRMTRGTTDGIDNDLDGTSDEADEAEMVELMSTGTFDGVMRTVRVTLLARYRTPQISAAAYLDDPMADFDLSGNAFLLSGVDIDLNGNPTGSQVAAIGVNGSTANVLAQITAGQANNIVGLGGTPSVQSVGAMDMSAMVLEGARSANVVLESGVVQGPANPGDWGTLDAPAIVYGVGDVKISSGAEGAGILIINGNLEITGGFEWQGLVIVGGRAEFKGGGGGKRIRGALVIEKDIFQALGYVDPEDGLSVTGTVDVLFSSQTITRISQVFRTYTILNWREGPNPDYEATP